MIKNVQSLKDRANNFAKGNNLTVQQVLQNYMFERFLERLSVSKYKEKLIIKGGLLLSSIIGINLRSTMDIDADIIGINFNKEESEYGGYRVKLVGNIENLKIPFHIDISTGDIITPKAIEYKYKKLLEDDYIEIYTYNQETIIAEKLQTILSRKIANSRMKDYYDLYYFVNFKWKEIDKVILKQAIYATFKNRNTENDLKNIERIIETITKDKTLHTSWADYKDKHSYAKNISFKDIINAIEFIKNEIK